MNYHLSLLLGIAVGTSLLASSPVWADGGGHYASRGGERHGMSYSGEHGQRSVSVYMLRHLLKNKQELGLSDEQIATMRVVALDADRAHIRAEADVMVSQRELRALLWDDKAELPSIEAKVREHEAFEATARIISIRAKRELIGVLTPEQRSKQKALWEQSRHGGRGHVMKADAEDSAPGRTAEAITDGLEIELHELESESSAG